MVTKVKQKSPAPTPKIEPVEETVEEIKIEPALVPWLTLETVLFTAILIVGLSLRLWVLGNYPLSDVEAQQSLVAFRLAQGESLETNTSYSPLLASLNALTFFLIHDSDTTARLAPVLFGVALLLLPMTLRRQLGTPVCLLASALLAVSPAAVFLSRTLNSEIGVAAGALMIVAGFFNWVQDGQKRWLYLLAGGIAVLLTAGPMAYSLIVVFAVIVLLKFSTFKALWRQGLNDAFPGRTNAPPEDESNSQRERRSAQPGGAGLPSSLRQAGIFLLVALLLLSTAATFNLSGFNVTTGLLSEWLSRFSFQPRSDSGFNAVFILTIYEILMVIAGLIGLTFVILRSDLLRFVLAGWFIGAILLDLAMAGRPTGNVILALVPLAFLAAIALAELWEGLRAWGSWSNEGLILASGLVIAGFGYIGLTGWLVRSCSPEDRFCQVAWLQAVAALILFLVIVIFFWLVNGPGIALRGLALTGVVVGLLAMISASGRLNYGPLMDLAYQPLAGVPASTRLVDLTETLTSESIIQAGDRTLLDITLLATTPALQWQLRDFENVAQASSLAETTPTSAIITSMANGEGLDLSEAYLGQDFAVNAFWSPVGLPPKDLIHWLIYREANQPPQGETIILWLRTSRG